MENNWYVLKQSLTEGKTWLIKLDENDPIYSYPTEVEARQAVLNLRDSYPNQSLIVEYIENASESYQSISLL